MSRMSPCKDCLERHTACHDSCEKYQQWVKDFRAEKRAYAAEKAKSYGGYWSPAKKRAMWLSRRRDYSGAKKKFSS